MTRLRYIALGVLLLAAPMRTWAQSAADRVDHDMDVLLQDAADIFTAPAAFDGRDWLFTGLIVGTAAAAWTVDDDVRAFAQESRSEKRTDLLRIGDYYGRGLYTSIFAAGLYSGGLAFDDEWSRVTGRMLLQSQVYTVLVSQLLKFALGRSRPYMNEGKGSFHFLMAGNDYWAHPSGHATSSFAFSSTLSRRVGSAPLSVLLYALSVVTVLQRIDADKHWLSDTFIGAVIGSVIGIAVVQAEEAREQGNAARVPLSASFSPHRPITGITLHF